MKVLIVHDRAEVGEEIRSIILDLCPMSTPELVLDSASARDRLGSTFFDLLVLDLTIPVVHGRGNVGLQAAEGLLEEIVGSATLLAPGSVLGITQDVVALDTIQNNVGPHLMAIIHEDVDGRWRRQLSDRVQYVRDSASARSRSLLTKHELDLLIITALDKELAPYREFFELQDYQSIEGVSEFVFSDKNGTVRRGACYAIGRAGQASAASDTQGLVCQLRPKLAIMTGFCGGVPGKAELGDILFAELAMDWDYGKWKPLESVSRLYARPEPIVIRNSATHRIARRIVDQGVPDPDPLEAGVSRMSNGEIQRPKIDLVPFASGSAVIADEDVLTSIKGLNENIAGVDMESFGFYFACEHAHAAPPQFICIKAVADHCSLEKDDRLHATCAFASAYIARTIATRFWDFNGD